MDAGTLLATIGGLWLVLAASMAVAWLVERRTGNSGWIDVIWTCAMGTAGVIGATALSVSDLTNRQVLVASLILLWALRLAWHITVRTQHVSDDPRYAKLRDEWGDQAALKMFGIVQAQALLSLPMLAAVVLGAWNPAPLFTLLDWLGLAVYAAALTGSYLSDAHLSRFKQNPDNKGKVCDTGLWSWSRHPNYFFEWLIWLSFALFAIDLGGWTWGYLALAGPLCIYWLLRYVSGVPPLEAHMVEKYGDDYRAYQARTSVFFPLPPSSPDSKNAPNG